MVLSVSDKGFFGRSMLVNTTSRNFDLSMTYSCTLFTVSFVYHNKNGRMH